MLSKFVGLTELVCNRAFAIVEPTMLAAMEKGVVNRSQGFMVVCDPRITYADIRPGVMFENYVPLFFDQFGDSTEWDYPFDEIALAKAKASWKTGLPSHRIQQEAPYLFEPWMAKYGGSAVGEGGLVVAFSGVEEYFDQMFSEMMLAAIKGVCLHEIHGPNGVMADDSIKFLDDSR